MNEPVEQNSQEATTPAPERRVEEKAEGLTTAAIAGSQPTDGAPAEPRTFSKPDAADPGAARAGAEDAAPLFSADASSELRGRWDGVQASFVDAPRKAVEEADSLVAEAMKRLAEMFAAERSRLESQWDRGDDVSTEDLRQALRRYRSFFSRLLSV